MRASLAGLAMLVGCGRPVLPAGGPEPLVLERAVPVAGPGDFQPSGLAFREGRLYTVSDKTSTALMEIELGDGAAVARAAIPVRPPEGPREDLDLEGLAVDGGNFLVVSEARDRVLAVPADGGPARWLDVDFAGPARAAGLLATTGAGFEGIARLGDRLGDRLILAAEREPRGLVVASDGQVDAWQMARTIVPLPAGRSADFADLAVDGGHLYGLVRNGDAIVELRPAGSRFLEARAWSYAAVAARYRYVDQRFGLGEGLAIDGQHLYVIFDNNGASRVDRPGDRRPMLLVFRWRRPPA
jgi:hypothetical protein